LERALRATLLSSSTKTRSDTINRKIVQALAIALTGLGSFLGDPVSGDMTQPRYAALMVVASAWLLIWAFGGLRRGERRERWLLWACGAFAAVIAVAATLSTFPAAAWTWGLITQLSAPTWLAALVVLLAVSRVSFTRENRLAVAALFVGAVPYAAYGIYQRLFIHEFVTAGFQNSNYFGPFMLCVAPVALGLAVTTATPWERWLWRAIALLVWCAALLSTSAAAAALAILELLAVAAVAPRLLGLPASRDRLARRVALIVTAVGVIGVLAVVSGAVPGTASARQELVGANLTSRVGFWTTALKVSAKRPILGFGPDGYGYAMQADVPADVYLQYQPGGPIPWDTLPPASKIPEDMHSLPLNLLTSFGILGLLAALGIAGVWTEEALREPEAGEPVLQFRRAAGIGAAIFGASSLIMPQTLVFGAAPLLVAGLALMRPAPKTEKAAAASKGGTKGGKAAAKVTQPAKAIQWSRVAPAIVVAAALVWLGIVPVAAVRLQWDAAHAQSIDEYLSAMHQVVALQPTAPSPRFSIAYQYALFAEQGDPTAYPQFKTEVARLGPDVLDFAPYLTAFVRSSLVAAKQQGRTDVSYEDALLKRAERTSPSFPDTLLERVHLEVQRGDAKAADAALAKALVYKRFSTRYADYEAMVAALDSAQAK
jgi:O-antigen ligase